MYIVLTAKYKRSDGDQYFTVETTICIFFSQCTNSLFHGTVVRTITTICQNDITHLRVRVILVGSPDAVTLVVTPAVVSARRSRIRILNSSRSGAAVRYLGLVSVVRALRAVEGARARGSGHLVDALLWTASISASVMHPRVFPVLRRGSPFLPPPHVFSHDYD